MTTISPENTFVHYVREKPFSFRGQTRRIDVPSRDDETNFTVVHLMDYRAVHSVHAGQQSPILQLLFSPEENHDNDIQLRAASRNALPFSISMKLRREFIYAFIFIFTSFTCSITIFAA